MTPSAVTTTMIIWIEYSRTITAHGAFLPVLHHSHMHGYFFVATIRHGHLINSSIRLPFIRRFRVATPQIQLRCAQRAAIFGINSAAAPCTEYEGEFIPSSVPDLDNLFLPLARYFPFQNPGTVHILLSVTAFTTAPGLERDGHASFLPSR